MNSHCTVEQLESALAGTLPADDEATLHQHLEACDSCSSTMEHLAGGDAWCNEAASLLAIDDLDADVPVREEFSEIDFTVEHLEPSDDPNALGQLGGYDVLEVIGRGGMGVVLKGYERALKRCVAIKVLAPHLAQSSLAKKRFAREAQAAAAVVHPNVLAIHQVQPTGRLPFLVMPLVAGESLAQRLAAKGSLELTEVLRIGLQAAAGLSAAHEQGLVHRDVKPANILLEKGIERAVLTDFGLARAADDVALTRWGIIAGTPQYMSPEQAKGEPVDGRSDLFSLGCVLYEMATGVSPFRTDSTMATLRRLIDEEPQAMSSLNPELPPWFIGIVEKLLEKDPSKRFSSAKEVCNWLEGCLAHVQQPNNVPLPAGLPTAAVHAKPRWGIGRWIATVAATLLLGSLGAGAVIVATADPPDISGEWNSEEWGRVALKQTSPGEYAGEYFLTTNKQALSPDKLSSGQIEVVELPEGNGKAVFAPANTPKQKSPADEFDAWARDNLVEKPDAAAAPTGEIQLKWSRIERRFNGTWKEGRDRFGDISVRLVDNEIRGAYTTSRKAKINPATPKLADFAWKKSTAEKLPIAGNLRFGPVIERVVNDDNRELGDFMIDLDTGKLISPPKEKLSQHDELKWIRDKGIDALGDMRPGEARLVGLDMIAIPVGSAQWDCTPEFLLELFAKEKLAKPDGKDLKPAPVVMSTDPKYPLPTSFFQTREGAKGVLQITGAIDKGGKPDRPRGVKIRYKLLQDPIVGILSQNLPHKNAMLRGRSLAKLVLDQGIDYLFTRADLQDCNLEGAKLVGGFKAFSETNFSAANLSGATLSGNAAFQRAKFDHANLSGAALQGDAAGFQESSFKSAILHNAKLTGGVSAFQLASFQQADMTGAVLEGKGSAFQLANFDSATLHSAKIVCHAGTAFQSVSINDTDFSGADLATIEPQSLTSCRFAPDSPPKYSSDTKLPAGFDPVRAGWKKVEPGSVSKTRTTKSTDKSDITNTIHKAEIELLETELRRTKQELAHTKALYDAKAATAAEYKAAKDAYETSLAKQEGSALRVAEIRLATAKHRMERAKELAEAKAITVEEFEKAGVELAVAQWKWLLVAPSGSKIDDASLKAPNSPWSFGPTKMEVLRSAGNGAGTFALNLKDGRVFNLLTKFNFLEDPTNIEEQRWVAETKINLVVLYLEDTDQWAMKLHNVDLAELSAGSWQSLSAAELERQFAGLKWQRILILEDAERKGKARFFTLMLPFGKGPPVNFAYQTSDGQRGILQFYAFNPFPDHREVLLRYRPLQKDELQPQRAPPNESKPVPPIKGRVLNHRVPFELGATFLKDGDRITIDEVRGTDATITRGAESVYEVKGTYRLASRDQATLLAGVTQGRTWVAGDTNFPELQRASKRENARRPDVSETVKIERGEGAFVLRFRVHHNGNPHVSFYPVDGGEGFAHVYFGTGDFVLKKGWWEEKKNTSDREYPKLAPYPAIRWPDDSDAGEPDRPKPTVQIDGRWSELQSINDLSVEEIVEFAQKQYESRWKMRFNEDLVQVLSEMGHPPGDSVKLVVRDVESGEVRTLEKAPMTRENRHSIWQAEADAESRPGTAKPPASQDPLAAIDALETALNDRWSYRHANNADFTAAIGDLRAKANAGLPHEKLGIELQKIIALGIDGHANVSGGAAPAGGCLPFLIEPSGSKLVAFTPDRSAFLASGFPYVTAIDGKGIAQWCNAARELVPKGSEQYVRHHCLRELRNLDEIRDRMSLPKEPLVVVELESTDGTRRESLTLPVANRPGTYAEWPRGESKLLDENIGYLRLRSMNRQAVNEIKEWMPKFRDTAGLIVDVRDNGGGSRDALLSLYSYLAAPDDPPRVVTAAAYRLHPEHRDDHLAQRFMYHSGAPEWNAKQQQAIADFAPRFNPQWTLPAGQFSDWHYMVLNRNDDPAVYHYNKPVCVLMNAKCFSATDIFLAGLKGIKNVTLMGTPSGGGGALAERLPLGNTTYRVRLGTMASFQADGKLFDGNGVQPDIVIEPTPEYYIGGPDNVLAAAVKRIYER